MDNLGFLNWDWRESGPAESELQAALKPYGATAYYLDEGSDDIVLFIGPATITEEEAKQILQTEFETNEAGDITGYSNTFPGPQNDFIRFDHREVLPLKEVQQAIAQFGAAAFEIETGGDDNMMIIGPAGFTQEEAEHAYVEFMHEGVEEPTEEFTEAVELRMMMVLTENYHGNFTDITTEQALKLARAWKKTGEDVQNVIEMLSSHFHGGDNPAIQHVVLSVFGEGTEKVKGGYENIGAEGKHSKKPMTKKAADDQRKAMFANGYHESDESDYEVDDKAFQILETKYPDMWDYCDADSFDVPGLLAFAQGL